MGEWGGENIFFTKNPNVIIKFGGRGWRRWGMGAEEDQIQQQTGG